MKYFKTGITTPKAANVHRSLPSVDKECWIGHVELSFEAIYNHISKFCYKYLFARKVLKKSMKFSSFLAATRAFFESKMYIRKE